MSRYSDIFQKELRGTFIGRNPRIVLNRIIDEQPTADVRENVKGEWVVNGQNVYCSHCNGGSAYNWFGASAFTKFCPNCGADMRGGDVG